VTGVLAVVGAATLWLAPGSPITLWRADSAVGMSDPITAVALYDDVGTYGWTTPLRRDGLRRAALLLAADLGRPEAARERLEALIDIESTVAERADLRERIGHLHRVERDPAAAGRDFLAAHEAATTHPRAAERLILAARSFTEANEIEVARGLWERLAVGFPTHVATARLAQARLALGEGDAQSALGYFDDAAMAARDPFELAAARLGVATSLERLGNLDEAIAEIDQAELPSSVRDPRMDGLRARQEDQSGASFR
jgi:tetratricopeptide (TPR) repeat protein